MVPGDRNQGMKNHAAAVEDAQRRAFGSGNVVAMLGHDPVIVTTSIEQDDEGTHITEAVYSLDEWNRYESPHATIEEGFLQYLDGFGEPYKVMSVKALRFPRNLPEFKRMLKVWRRKGGDVR